MASKKRDKKRTAQASTGLTLQKTSTSSSGGESLEEVTDSNEARVDLRQAFATTDLDHCVVLGLQVASSLANVPWPDDEMSIQSTRAAVSSLGVRDGLEALLAVQMVGVHNLAMTFLARAALQGQTPEGLELCTNFANRLLRTFTAQVETLKSYRSKGEQKVAVEHVHIHRGGQAIVGAVNHSPAGGGGGDDKKDKKD